MGVLLLALAGCQPAVSPPAAAQPPPPPVAAAAGQPAPPASAAIWAQVPRQICTCHEDALERVETSLQDSQLAVQFKMESGTEGWHVFSVTFDPARVSADRVSQLLKDTGALVIPAPVGH
jgi:hypothetical protein